MLSSKRGSVLKSSHSGVGLGHPLQSRGSNVFEQRFL